MVFTSTTVTVTNAFCSPLATTYNCAYQDNINDFILVGESNTQINNVGTGCAAGGYESRVSSSVTLFANTPYTAFVSSQYSSSEYLGIWIDFNDNWVFEATEQVATRLLNSTLRTPVTLTIPAIGSGAVVGSHRMRVVLSYGVTANACQTGVSYGETHDYTVNIIAYTGEWDSS